MCTSVCTSDILHHVVVFLITFEFHLLDLYITAPICVHPADCRFIKDIFLKTHFPKLVFERKLPE